MSIHCCETNKCTGSVYNNWFLICRLCKKKSFIECLRNRDEMRTKELLRLFELMSFYTMSDGREVLKIDKPENPNKVAAFSHMFNPDSPFGIVCDVCIHKNEIANEAGYTSTKSKTEHHNTDIERAETDTKNTSKLKPPSTDFDDNYCDVYAIHVSKFHEDVESDFIVSHITEKTDINPDFFKVEKLTTKRRRRVKYSSFKIITLKEEIYRKILNHEVWSPDYTARRFEKYRNRKFSQHTKQQHRHRTTRNQHRAQKHGHQQNTNNKKFGNKNSNNNNNNRNNPNRPLNRRHDNRNNKPRGKSWSNNDDQPRYQQHHYRHQGNVMKNHEQLSYQNYPAPFWYPQQYIQPPIHGYQTLPQQQQIYSMPQMYQPFNLQFHH